MDKQFEESLLQFARLDAESKRLKNEAEPIKKQIKTYMQQNDLGNYEVGDVTAKYDIQDRSKMNEDKLLEKLKSLGLEEEAVYTVEKPDHEQVENLIFSGDLDPEDLNDCIDRKEVSVLTVKGGDKIDD